MSGSPKDYKQIVLNERPVADFEPTTFRTEVLPFNLKAGEGEVLVRVTYISLDPAMRGYVRDARSYLPPVKIGEVMRATGLGIVVEAGPGSTFQVGDNVRGLWGMTEYAVMKDADIEKLTIFEGAQPLDYMSTLGLPGLAAYFGFKDIAQVKKDDVFVVSAAAGAVGSIVCQLGKQVGAKVYGIAGSSDKCEWLEKELGIDGAFNYNSSSFREDFKKIGYVDAYFDNVGGDTLDMILTRLAKDARIALCGAISQYNAAKPAGLKNYQTLIGQRALMKGFIVFDHTDRFPEALKHLSTLLAGGSIKRKFHIVEGGIEQCPVALPLLYSGGNTGKLLVKISDDGSKSRL